MLAAGRTTWMVLPWIVTLADLALFDLVQEVREDLLGLADLLAAENIEQQQEHQPDHQPERDTAGKLVHS